MAGAVAGPGAPARAAIAPVPQAYGATVTLSGHGFGHGIGMSQVGAYGYATHFGWSWDQILAHYYGGTSLGPTDPNQALSVRLTATDDGLVTAVIQDAGLAGTSANGYAAGYRSLAAVEFAPSHYRVYGLAGSVACPAATTTGEFEAPGSPWAIVAPDVPSADFAVLGVDTNTAPVASLLGVCEPAGSDQLHGGIRARYYRGVVRAVNGSESEDRTVNIVPLDRYIQGVVPREMPASWGGDAGGAGMNALRAQAVAARSYALTQNRYTYAKTCDTQSCQVYGGAGYRAAVNPDDGGPTAIVSNESAFANQAVIDTAGQVLLAGGNVISAMYSASSGGYTSDEGAFPAVVDDGDQFSPLPDRHDWSATLKVSTIEAAYPQIGTLQLLNVTSRNELGDGGGRVRKIDVIGTAGTVSVSGDAFQSAFGLRSNWFFVPSACDGRVVPPSAGLPPATPVKFEPVTPARVLDTRTGLGSNTAAALGASCALALPIAGVGGVPATGVSAVAVNVTATGAQAPGFLTVYPCGVDRPLASNVNYGPGDNVANMAQVRLGVGGQICIYALATVHVVVDVLGWYGDAATSGYQPLTPTRALDTRNGTGGQNQAVPAGGVVGFAPGASAAVPADADGVMLNLTSTASASDGYLTAFPCGGPIPPSSNVNYDAGSNVANQAAIGVGTNGQVCVSSFATSHVVADVLGWFGPTASSSYVPLAPARVLDTRVDNAVFTGKVPAGGIVALPVLGQGGIPASGVTAAALNVTVDQPSGPGYVTVFPCGATPPLASNLNYAAGQVAANLATTPLGDGGQICLFSFAATHLVVDVSGYFVFAPPPSASLPSASTR
jgi:SpoIID/LytB domain protein